MKRIKRFTCLFMIVFISVFCCSCGEPNEGDELVRCLNERDKEGIMELFCDSVASSPHIDFDQQISDVFDLFGDRTITSYRGQGGSKAPPFFLRRQPPALRRRMDNIDTVDPYGVYSSMLSKRKISLDVDLYARDLMIGSVAIPDINEIAKQTGKNPFPFM